MTKYPLIRFIAITRILRNDGLDTAYFSTFSCYQVGVDTDRDLPSVPPCPRRYSTLSQPVKPACCSDVMISSSLVHLVNSAMGGDLNLQTVSILEHK